MSLHGLIQVNGSTIGSWSAQRITTRPDGLHTYRWKVTEREQVWTGDLQHDYADGAVALAAAVLTAARACTPAPCPDCKWTDAQDLWEPEARQVLAHPCHKHTHTEEDQ